MTRPNYNLIRFIHTAIRMMKREYGGSITVYRLVDTTTNFDTGVKSHTHNSTYIPRAVVLPSKMLREVTQTISLISSNKKIVQGGSYDTGLRWFIIDRSDVASTFTLDKDDWIVYDSARYDIIEIDEFEYRTAWMIKAKRIDGEAPVRQDHYLKTNGYLLDLEQTVSVTVE